MTEAYPLAWPAGWPRTPHHKRTSGAFNSTFNKTMIEVRNEVGRLGGRYIIISSDIPLRQDGFPYASSPEPKDPGIAVYFEKGGKQRVFACDQYDKAWKNLRAIQKTIEAIRGIERSCRQSSRMGVTFFFSVTNAMMHPSVDGVNGNAHGLDDATVTTVLKASMNVWARNIVRFSYQTIGHRCRSR